MTDNDLEVATDVVREKSWRQVEFAQTASSYLVALSLLLVLCVFLGYLFAVERFFRPFSGGPATHPLTMVCLILAGGNALLVFSPKMGRAATICAVTIIFFILLVRLCDSVFSAGLTPYITPFQSSVLETQARGGSNSFGVNSILMFVGLAGALVLVRREQFGLAQGGAFFSAFIPAVSLVGYLYGLNDFHGEMSLLTAASGLFLALGIMCMTAHVGVVRAVLSPYAYGWVFRSQCVAGIVVPVVLGFTIAALMDTSDQRAFGVYVVGNIWFILMLVGVSAFFLEQVDQQRRHSEQLLLEAATQDQLTHLANRRKFFDFGRHEIQRLHRAEKELWLLMLDLDHFKSINDTAGHDMGDKVLVMVSRGMQKCVRNIDLVGRLGGEEFAILLSDSSREGAERVARCILERVRTAFVFGWTDIHGPVTVSIGGAEIQRGGTLEEALKEADNALYQAKRQGRDQVVFASRWHYRKEKGLA